MESINKIKQNKWLNLLEEAINEKVEIQVNHRFKYKNKCLGTFLVSAKSKQNPELIKKIELLGVNFKMHSKQPEHYLEKFILQLSTDKKPNKQHYITRFNQYVLPKKELLKDQTIKKLNKVWKRKFGDIRKWEKPETIIDKIENWKEFRYNSEINPTGKWFDYRVNMGKLYGWVYLRKRDKQKMGLILEHFTKEEIAELQKEGF
ncbi:hypothetical protein [uncultured Polaribacter sp.]|uniref:hypothetical protein n=1 Tax=uncultured Polaribacter sp. TaxID=174711 RepID=UPI0026253F17|nr:hypothetical protein [uncultured Polaribacter sp.]